MENLSLRFGCGVVLEPFLNRVFGAKGVRHVTLVSPFLSHLPFATGTTAKLLDRLAIQRTRLILVTREPDQTQLEHKQFLNDVAQMHSSQIYFLDSLHAKFYICETVDRSFAVIGSPNLYRWTRASHEIGVAIEGRGSAEALVDDLIDVALTVRTSKDTRLFKRQGEIKCLPQ